MPRREVRRRRPRSRSGASARRTTTWSPRIGQRQLEIGIGERVRRAIAQRRGQDQQPLVRRVGLEVGRIDGQPGDVAQRPDRAAQGLAHARRAAASPPASARRPHRGNGGPPAGRAGRPATGWRRRRAPCVATFAVRVPMTRRRRRPPPSIRAQPSIRAPRRARTTARAPLLARRLAASGARRFRSHRFERARAAQRDGRRDRGEVVLVGVGLARTAQAKPVCALPSNTVRQWPQRTWPPRSASCSGVTRNTVLQPGQRVNFGSAMDGSISDVAIGPAERPRAATQPSAVRQGAILNQRAYAVGDLRRLRLENARQRDASRRRARAARAPARAAQRVGQDVRDDDVERAGRQRVGRDEARVDAVRARVVRGWRAMPADRCRCRRRGRAPSFARRRSRGCRSRSRSRAATRPRETPRASHSRHSRVVGCVPVPNASPGSSARLSAAGSRRLRTTSARSRIRSAISIGPNCACVARTQSCSATGIDVRAPGTSMPSAPRSAAAARRQSASAREQRRERATRPQRARRGSPGSPNIGVSSGVPASGSEMSTDERARVEQRVRPCVRVRGVDVEAERDVAHLLTLASGAVQPTPCASRAALRGSGSSCRRA